jgi:hypothetical protein
MLGQVAPSGQAFQASVKDELHGVDVGEVVDNQIFKGLLSGLVVSAAFVSVPKGRGHPRSKIARI